MALVTLVDEHDNIVGTKERDELSDTDRWRIVAIWVTNSDGDILIAKRSAHKKLDPEKWGPAASGTVDYPEDYLTTAKREAKEEIGVDLPNLKIEKVIFYKSSSLGNRACGLARATIDKDAKDFIIQNDEVEEVKWVTKDKLKEDLIKNPRKYVAGITLLAEYFVQ
jgi:isopentenyl-diphosphate delta-isomerase